MAAGVVGGWVEKKYVSKPSDLDAVLSGFDADAVEGKLFIFLDSDEAVYGGCQCKKSTGKLNKLITEDHFNSEQKFKVRRTVENCASICMASNEDHVVQAGRNSRRWLALLFQQIFWEQCHYRKLRILSKGPKHYGSTMSCQLSAHHHGHSMGRERGPSYRRHGDCKLRIVLAQNC